ncbi:MAG: type II toxin-antitoxin system Phd/YefM family antitoxin [Thermoleophilia bacterium]|nr:type II toxin-antitoxin system Phd/YefM family antitoxin [Thermoleophilia bacterium]
MRCTESCTLPLVAKVVPFTRARAELSDLLDEVEARHEHVIVTRKGRPIAIVLSTEEWEAIEETLEILQDEETLEALRESDEDVAAGRVTPLSEVLRDLRRG